MKIPLKIYDFAGGLRSMAHFILMNKEPHIFTSIRAIVDTGSPTTIIGPLDREKMRLSKVQLNKLTGKKIPINYGGSEVVTIELPEAKIKFIEKEFELPITIPIKNEMGATQPSILGVDFMLKNKCKFIFNPSIEEAYFEMED